MDASAGISATVTRVEGSYIAYCEEKDLSGVGFTEDEAVQRLRERVNKTYKMAFACDISNT